MTYASHARVITGIIQANLTHLSIKMTTPHQSGAPFVGERVFQNRGVCGQAFPSFPSPTAFLQPFCSRPIFRVSRMCKTSTRYPNFIRFVRERLLRRLLQPIFKKPIHAKRMLLCLLCYNLAVIYKKGSLMYLADHLSRALLDQEDEGKEPDEFQVFATVLESMSPFDAIKLSSKRLVQLQTCVQLKTQF